MSDNTFQTIGASPYILLPDGTVARKLKPTMLNGVPHWDLCLGKSKTMRIRNERLDVYATAFSQYQEQIKNSPDADSDGSDA